MSKSPLPESTIYHIEELMTGHVLNDLSAEESRELAAYLSKYPELAEQLCELEAVMGLMGHTVPPAKASTQLKDRILQAAQASTAQTEYHPSRRRPVLHQFSKTWIRSMAIAAGLLLLIVGLDNLRLRQQLAQDKKTLLALAEQIDVLKDHSEVHQFDLKGTSVATSALGSVILDFDRSQATVALQNLPPAPEGFAYYLWAFTQDKKVLCGSFNTTSDGKTLAYIPFDPKIYGPEDEVLFMRISREPAVTPLQPDRRVLVMTSES